MHAQADATHRSFPSSAVDTANRSRRHHETTESRSGPNRASRRGGQFRDHELAAQNRNASLPDLRAPASVNRSWDVIEGAAFVVNLDALSADLEQRPARALDPNARPSASRTRRVARPAAALGVGAVTDAVTRGGRLRPPRGVPPRRGCLSARSFSAGGPQVGQAGLQQRERLLGVRSVWLPAACSWAPWTTAKYIETSQSVSRSVRKAPSWRPRSIARAAARSTGPRFASRAAAMSQGSEAPGGQANPSGRPAPSRSRGPGATRPRALAERPPRAGGNRPSA
jgi:hypothetical protein